MGHLLNRASTLFKSQKDYSLVYALLFFAALAYYFLTWPIFAGDTDLWYHLSGGRYIFDQNSIPDSSYFSFLTPARAWVNYYWLFQVLVYKIHSLFSYHGLVFLRAILYLATVVLIFCFLLDRGKKRPLSRLHLTLLVSYALLLIPRFHLVRPHAFSYLFIIAFLLILERKPKWAIALPLLAMHWVNLHGMEYPIIVLICLAYLIDIFIGRLRGKIQLQKSQVVMMSSLGLAVLAVWLTPHGAGLFALPFKLPQNTSLYINEMTRIPLAHLLSFQATNLIPTHATVFNFLFVTACCGALYSIYVRKVRASHLVLFVAGLFLLSKGVRFKYEFALLALPGLNAQTKVLAPILSSFSWRRLPKPLNLALAVLLATLPFLYLQDIFSSRPKYPFSQKRLPHGIAAFLEQIDVGGSVLNTPENGGYLQWRLYPRYKIAMDLEMSIFTDRDYFETANALDDEQSLRHFVAKYDPSFISVYLNRKQFKKLIQNFPDFVPVFFDDSEVLFANKTIQPDIVDQFALKEIDPFNLEGTDVENLEPAERAALLAELFRLHELFPHGSFVNRMIAVALKEDGEAGKGLRYAELIIREYPELPQGYIIRGDLLTELGQLEGAVSCYGHALERSDRFWTREINKKLWFCYTKLDQHERAYSILKKAVNPFSPASNFEDIFNLGSSALMVGKKEEGKMLLEFAYHKVPADNQESRERIEGFLAMLDDEGDGRESSTF